MANGILLDSATREHLQHCRKFSWTKWASSYFHFKLRYFVAVFNESIYIFFSGYAFEYLIETLNDSSRKKFFNVPRLGGTKYGNVT